MAESQEYNTLKQYIPEVRTAIKSHLTSLGGKLTSSNLISPEYDARLRNLSISEEDRAAELVSLLLDKVKLNKENYRTFLDVLRTSGGHFNDILSKLESPEAQQESGCVGDSQQTGLQASTSAISDSRVPIGALGMTCGCGICTSELGCRDPIPSEIKFPLFDKSFGSLDGREKQNFLFELRRDTIQIMKKFYRLASELYNSINHGPRPVTVHDLRANLYEIKAYLDIRSKESIFDGYKEDFDRVQKMEEIFNVITEICSFLDHDLLENLTNAFGTKEDKERIAKYRKDFAEYAKRRTSIYECPCIEPADCSKWSDVYVKLDSRLEAKLNIEQLREFRHQVSEILRINKAAIRFCCAQKGCIELKFQLPKFLEKTIVPLSFEKKTQLKQIGVIQFSTNDYRCNIKNIMATNTDESMFNKWLKKTGRGMTLVTAGQSGVGKSTLVKNLLCLADNDANAPIAEQSPDSVTKVVIPFHGYINGVKITIVDMPGLAAASDDEEKKIIAELIKVTEGGADMLLYCANMGPSGKLNELDRKIVKLLTSVFKPEIWERAILVLTFGDIVRDRNQKQGTTVKTPTIEAAMNRYAVAFGKILDNSTDQVKVIPVLKGEGAELRPAKEIAAVVSSETPGEEVLPGMKWDMCLYEEVLKKCEYEAIPSILKVILEPVPDYVQKEADKGAKRGTIGGIFGGAAAGGTAGAGIGAVVGGGIGAIPGAIGGAIVGAVGGGIGGRKGARAIYYDIAYNRYLESEEGQHTQLLKEIEGLRIKDIDETNGEVQQESRKEKTE